MAAQSWNTDTYARGGGFVPQLGAPLLDWLQPVAGEDILDLGCGDGKLTARIAASGARIRGVDAAREMVDAARARALDVHLGDGMALNFDEAFDAVVSNAALHWMPDADAVIAGVHQALRPGGRFVAEFGGHGNIAAVQVAILAVLGRHGLPTDNALPWYFPTADAYRDRLTRHGFTVTAITSIPRPTPLPGHMNDWLDIFANGVLSRFPPDVRDTAKTQIVELLRPVLWDASGTWTADYVRLRFVAYRR